MQHQSTATTQVRRVPKNQEIRIMRNPPLSYEQAERLWLQKQDHRRVLTMFV
jgi:hypothetical protein